VDVLARARRALRRGSDHRGSDRGGRERRSSGTCSRGRGRVGRGDISSPQLVRRRLCDPFLRRSRGTRWRERFSRPCGFIRESGSPGLPEAVGILPPHGARLPGRGTFHLQLGRFDRSPRPPFRSHPRRARGRGDSRLCILGEARGGPTWREDASSSPGSRRS